MTYTIIDMEPRPERIWNELPLGAKVTTGVIAVALIGASLVASIFLAGAALFSGLVMMIYGAVRNRARSSSLEDR